MKRHSFLLALGLILGVGSLASFVPAHAQTVTINVSPASADVRATPTVTWSTTPAATSCTAAGGWAGSKAASGTQTLPEVTRTTSYALTCVFPGTPGTTGSTIVSWIAPTTQTDGTPYTNAAGTRIFWGTSATALDQSFSLQDPAAREWTSPQLAHGTWYFMVRPFNTLGVEAANSNIASRLIGTAGTPGGSASNGATLTIRPAPMPATITSVAVVAGVNAVPVFRVSAAGNSIGSTPFGLIPTGRPCGAKVSTWRGTAIHRVEVQTSEVWPRGTSTANLAAPCGLQNAS